MSSTNRRYFLVVLDDSGRSVRRIAIERKTLQIARATAGMLAAALCMALLHGLWSKNDADEALFLREENAMLREVSSHMEGRLPFFRTQSMQAERTFAQAWSKSGLGAPPNVWGVGPLTDDAALPEMDTALSGLGSHVLVIEPAALPLELDRIEEDAVATHAALGELLEYFHDADVLLSYTPSVRPTHGYLTSNFGKRRDPIRGTWVIHKGLDIGGEIGMRVGAPAAGVVVFVGIRGGYGNTVVIDHGYGLQTHYAHLSAFRVKANDHVQRGDWIADVGNTGRSTGPHLHYEVRRLGRPVNPLHFILD